MNKIPLIVFWLLCVGLFSTVPAIAQQSEESSRPWQHQPRTPLDLPEITPVAQIDSVREILREIADRTGVKPAIIYVNFIPQTIPYQPEFAQLEAQNTQAFQNYLNTVQPRTTNPSLTFAPQPDDQLELLMLTAEGTPVRQQLTVTREEVQEQVRTLRRNVTNVRRRTGFFDPAQQLYDWMIDPLKADLEAREIENLVFILTDGLRLMPLAALHDGEQFIIETYSVSLMPSLALTDTRYIDLKNLEVLAMGASEFTDQDPLPAVPLELELIADQIWQGRRFLNQDFTTRNLTTIREQTPYGIVHLGTHGEFRPGSPENSYIQFNDSRLRLDEVRELALNDPTVELLVLSACRTALGDTDAELGFAGLAAQAGVKTAMGSLWYVSDTGTLTFMTAFYEQLQQAPIKAEALRQAQVAMMQGEARIENGQIVTPGGTFPLTSPLAELGDRDLRHPYYWSAFTMIGSPW
ncbi:MAG: CHAT domain-containing protein [Kamptonema sp. SIO4C4]|nr:CHAT domain-containing protein [Kamptonema sp. SIO4C4]